MKTSITNNKKPRKIKEKTEIVEEEKKEEVPVTKAKTKTTKKVTVNKKNIKSSPKKYLVNKKINHVKKTNKKEKSIKKENVVKEENVVEKESLTKEEKIAEKESITKEESLAKEEQTTKEENVVKKENLTKEEISAQIKERNRRKYENQQKKYRENKEKKKLVVEDIVEKVDEKEVKKDEKEALVDKEETLVKKAIGKDDDKSLKKEKEKERKEKRKTNRKTSGFTQTLNNIKEMSVNKINDVREKVDDDTIPLGKTFNDKSKRSKRLLKEAIVYAILLTIINIICIVAFDDFNFLRLFDVKVLNIILTILISLLFNFFVAFMIDYFVTNVWLVKRRKKKDGEPDGNSRTNEKKHRKDIKNKEGN